ncbi:MAG: cobalamin-dependent protein, partial [Pseudomonadota bacterium]
ADAAEMLLALRRIGGKRLEELFGAGTQDETKLRGRDPVVQSPLVEELTETAEAHLARVFPSARAQLATMGASVLVATTDVHEHGKMLLESALRDLGVEVLDGGVSTDPDNLAALAASSEADAIAVSTFNGIALDYIDRLFRELERLGLDTPVLVGGRLNQIPEGSNTSLPVDVSDELSSRGAIVCREIEDCVPALIKIGTTRKRQVS